MTARNSNRLFNLPQEIQNLIFDYARDDTKKKKFNKDFRMYFKIRKYIRENFDYENTRFYLKNDDEDDNKHFILYLKSNEGTKKFFLSIKTHKDLKDETDDFIRENISYIHNDLDMYKRCLKNEYYIKNCWLNGFKNSIGAKIKMHLQNEENEKLFNMLDLDTFKHNYFMYNSLSDLLNYYEIGEINIKEDGELPNTKCINTYNLCFNEY